MGKDLYKFLSFHSYHELFFYKKSFLFVTNSILERSLDRAIGDQPLKFRFPRLFSLETNKLITVAERKREGIGLASFRS